MTFPRVLIVSSTRVGTQTATGSAMANLFAGWPKDRLAQLHTDRLAEPDDSVCERFFLIRSRIDRLRRVPIVGRVVADRFGRNGRWAQVVNLREAVAWAEAFAPDVVYHRLVDEPACFRWLPEALAQRLGVPYVAHIMDDWPTRFADRHGDRAAERMHAQLVRTFRGAAASLAICDKMARDFGERYGVGFETFHNAVDADEWRGIARRRGYERDGEFRVLYSGSLAEDMCLQSVIDLADAVGQLRSEGRPIVLDISTAEWWRKTLRQHLAHRPGVRDAGFPPREGYLQSLADADLLALPINFDDRSVRYVRYSMSNKAPEYMAAGVPILAYGPRESATIGYADAEGWAYTVTERGVERLADALRVLMDDAGQRASLASIARRFGRERHDADANRARFRDVLARAAASRVSP